MTATALTTTRDPMVCHVCGGSGRAGRMADGWGVKRCRLCSGAGVVPVPPQIACGDLPDPSGLLAWVIADQDEDHHRLGYADWLQEEGHEQRARFIRLQTAREVAQVPLIALTTVEAVMGCQPHQMQRKAVAEHASVGNRTGSTYADYARGFISRLSCTWETWAEHGDALRAREWVPRVTLSGYPAQGNPPARAGLAHRRGDGATEWELAGRVVALPGNPSVAAFLAARWPGTAFTLPG